MPLKDFCRAIYAPNGEVKRQSAFIRTTFQAAGSRYACTDTYWSQVFDRVKPMGVGHAETFPNLINKDGLQKFLYEHLTPPVNTDRTLEDRCIKVATALGLPLARDIQVEPFVWALTDWFNAIIHATETDEPLKQAYLKRVEGIDLDVEQTNRSLYPGDMAEDMRSANDGKREVPFWKRFNVTINVINPNIDKRTGAEQ